MTYVHCHAGAYRSPTAVYLWLRYKGLSIKKAALIAKSCLKDSDEETLLKLAEKHASRFVNVPKQTEEFFRRLRANPNWSLMSILTQPLLTIPPRSTRKAIDQRLRVVKLRSATLTRAVYISRFLSKLGNYTRRLLTTIP